MRVTSDYEARFARYTELMRSKGVRRSVYDPLGARMLRALGFATKPVYFVAFRSVAILLGSIFAVWFAFAIGVLLPALGSNFIPRPPNIGVLVGSVLGGIVFGVCMALWTKYQAKKLELPDWDTI